MSSTDLLAFLDSFAGAPAPAEVVYGRLRPIPPEFSEPGDIVVYGDCSGYDDIARHRAQARLETHFGMLSR